MRVWKLKTFWIALTIGALIAAGELAVRTRAYLRSGSWSVTGDDLFVDDPVLGRVPRAKTQQGGAASSITINSLGFRGAEFPTTKPAGTYRVFCVGDSVLFGAKLAREEQVVTSQLQKHLAAMTGRTVHVINAAVPGYTISSAAAAYEHRARPLSPDMLVVVQVVNDLKAALRTAFGDARAAAASDDAPGLNPAYRLAKFRDENFLLYHLTRKNLTPLVTPLGAGVDCHDTVPDDLAAGYSRDLAALGRQARADGVQVAVCTARRAFSPEQPLSEQKANAAGLLLIVPNVSLEGMHAAFAAFDRAVRDVAAAEGAILADMARRVPADAALFEDPTHLNAEGHALAGRILAELLAPHVPAEGQGGV